MHWVEKPFHCRVGISLAVELLHYQLVQQRGIGLALRQAHDLADEEGGDRLLAAAILLDLLWDSRR